MNENIFSEYLTSNIPFYYMIASQQQLFDSSNSSIQIPYEIQTMYHSLKYHDKAPLDEKHDAGILLKTTTDDRFFPEQPLIMVKQRAEMIAKNQELRNKMQSEVECLMTTYVSSQDTQTVELSSGNEKVLSP